MVLFLKKLAKEKTQGRITTFYIMQREDGMDLMRELFPKESMQEGLAEKYYNLCKNVFLKNKKVQVDFDLNEICYFINENNPNTNEKQTAVIVYLEELNEKNDIHLARGRVCKYLIEESSINEGKIIKDFSLLKTFNKVEKKREIDRLNEKLKEEENKNKIIDKELNRNRKTVKNLGNSAIGKVSMQLGKIVENLKQKVIKSENNIKKLTLNFDELKKQITK